VKRRNLCALVCLFSATLAALNACSSDDVASPAADGGLPDAPANIAPTDAFVPVDAGVDASGLACGDSRGAPARALLVQGIPRGSELAAVNLETKVVDGRFGFDGGYALTSSLGSEPYLLVEDTDDVLRLDAREPWKPVATWNVRGDDAIDGGDPNANPVAVVPVSCTKAYVLRFNRDKIAILDQSAPPQAGAGAPKGYIDLAPFKAAGDPNFVEMTSAVYVPSKRRVYVLLGNSDLTRYVTLSGPSGDETKLLCTAALKPSILAIDVDTDKVVSLGGTAAGGGIELAGYNPPIGTPLVYDAVLDRLLVLQAGCNEEPGDGGVGGIIRRRVEQVELATGMVKTLLPLDANEFPSTLAFVDGDHAAVAFYFDGYRWDPHQSALGAAVAGGVDLVATDGRGGFFGTRGTFVDGGVGPVEVLSIPISDAGPDVVLSGPFSKLGGYVSGLEAWPHL
jgi:hypothetical protein